MINRIIVILLILIFAGLAFVIFRLKPNKERISPIESVPANSAIIIKANGVIPLVALMNENNFLCSSANDCKIGVLHRLLDSLSNEDEKIEKVLNETAAYLTITPNNRNKPDLLFLAQLGNDIKKEAALEALSPIFRNFQLKCVEYLPDRLNEKNDGEWYCHLENGLLMLSNNAGQIHSSLLTWQNKTSLLKDTSFIKVYNTSGTNIPASVFVNFKSTRKLLNKFLQDSIDKKFLNLIPASGWAALDVNLSQKNIILQGFAKSEGSRFIGSELLKAEQATENPLFDYIGQGAFYTTTFNLSDPYNLKLAIDTYIKKNTSFSSEILNVKKEIGSDLYDKFIEISGGSAGLFVWDIKNRFETLFIYKVSDEKQAENYIKSVVANSKDTSKVNAAVKLKSGKLPFLVAGDVLKNYSFEYGCFYKDYLLFSEDELALKTYLQEITDGKTIKQDSLFQMVSNDLILSKSNLCHIFFLKKSAQFFSRFFNDSTNAIFNKIISKNKAIAGLQMSGNNDMVYLNGFVYNENTSVSDVNLNWQFDLDTSVQLLQNIHFNKNTNLFFVQDFANSIYLITEYGRLIWKKQLDGKILGKVHEIDFFKNNKYQLLFNTSKKLYVIDKNGNFVEDFPVDFKNEASNGLEIADFEQDKNYRLYIAFNNKSFIALTKEGRKVDGWKFEKSSAPVTKPAKSFSYKQKDYIVFYDSTHIYLLNRKGENKIIFKEKFTAGENTELYIEKKSQYFRMLFVDKTSKLFVVYPDGRAKNISLSEYSNAEFLPINDNSYVSADSSKISFLDDQFSLIKAVETEEPARNITANTKNSVYIAFVYNTRKQVNLINAKGIMLKGSPLFGDYPFLFISLSNVPDKNVLCSSGSTLFYYSLP